MRNIRFLILDVDGTLTDGKIYMGERGEVMKVFDIKDGYAICGLLPENEIVPIVITSRKSRIVENRCAELGITEVYQKCIDKYGKLKRVLTRFDEKGTLSNCAYIGDDLLDLQCMISIKQAGGVIGCPADAASEVKKICDFVSTRNGGAGAVREFVEWIISG